ncbi:VTT domain-containing protein [Usitatibacter rugosus]|nr:VTT domain-containing protein [Usitatibacter rugosus]
MGRASRASMVVDGENYFEAAAAAMEKAERSILLLAWDFDSRTFLEYDESGKGSKPIGEFLNQLARKRRRLRIRILDWDYPMVFGTDREFPPTYGLSWKPHRHVQFRYDDTHPFAGSHHQKILVIDDKIAFVGGLDITSKRWDTHDHKPKDSRRCCDGNGYPPFHDVMMLVDGEAASAVARVARQRWRFATGETIRTFPTTQDPWPEHIEPQFTDVNVGVACTYPEQEGEKEIRDVEKLYLDMIAKAKDYIYLENQYFTSEAIGKALGARLDEPDGPEIVLVTRKLSHGWLEEVTMHLLRTHIVKDLRQRDKHGRFHAFYPDICGLEEGTCVDLHSKVMIADDEWLRVGSANLSNRSMGLDTECDLVIHAEGRDDVRKAIRTARDTLLAEHCDSDIETVERELEQRGSIAAVVEALSSDQRGMRRLEDKEVSEGVSQAIASFADPEKPISLDKLVGEFAPRDTKAVSRKIIPIAGVILAVVALTLAWRYTPLKDIVTPQSVADWADRASDYWWMAPLIFIAYTPASFVMFPRPLITLASVVAFGAKVGALLSISGILFAAMVGYFLGRAFDRDRVHRFVGPRMERVTHFLQRRGLVAMTLVRLVPIAPFQVVSIIAGAIRVKARDFLIGTAAGMLPGLIATAVLGDQVLDALRNGAHPNYWIVGAAIAVFAGIAFAGQRWLLREKARRPA